MKLILLESVEYRQWWKIAGFLQNKRAFYAPPLSLLITHTHSPENIHTTVPQKIHTKVPQKIQTTVPQKIHTTVPQNNHVT